MYVHFFCFIFASQLKSTSAVSLHWHTSISLGWLTNEPYQSTHLHLPILGLQDPQCLTNGCCSLNSGIHYIIANIYPLSNLPIPKLISLFVDRLSIKDSQRWPQKPNLSSQRWSTCIRHFEEGSRYGKYIKYQSCLLNTWS